MWNEKKQIPFGNDKQRGKEKSKNKGKGKGKGKSKDDLYVDTA